MHVHSSCSRTCKPDQSRHIVFYINPLYQYGPSHSNTTMSRKNVLIFAENIIFPKGELCQGPFYVLVKQGKIKRIIETEDLMYERCDAVACHLLAPGFVDIHNHGLGGEHDAMEHWQRPGYTCSKAVISGTTSILASVVFPEDSNKADSILEQLEENIGKRDFGAVIEGIHAEGPLLSECDGLPKCSKKLNANEFGDLLEKIPSLKVMTLSPAILPKLNYQPIKMLHDRGIVPALGHDRQANEQEIIEALSVSSSQPCHVTHMFNVSKFHHRNPGLVSFGLLEEYPFMMEYENVVPPTVELIGDLVHVHPLAVKLVLSSRDWKNIVFVTNCVSDKRNKKLIKYCEKTIEVDKNNGVVKSCDDNLLVGSCTTMLDIFKRLLDEFDVPVGKASMMLSENPARIAQLDDIGTIEVGKEANLILFDTNYDILKTLVAGRVVFRTSACRRKRVVSTESFDESFEETIESQETLVY